MRSQISPLDCRNSNGISEIRTYVCLATHVATGPDSSGLQRMVPSESSSSKGSCDPWRTPANGSGMHDAQGVTGSSPVRPTEKVQVSGVQGAVAVQPESQSAIRLLPNGSASEITAAHGGRAGAGTQRLAIGAPQPRPSVTVAQLAVKKIGSAYYSKRSEDFSCVWEPTACSARSSRQVRWARRR